MKKKVLLIYIQSFFMLVLLWWLISGLSPESFIPSPFPVFMYMYNLVLTGEFIKHMAYTLERVILGFFIAAVISITIGILMGVYFYVEKLFEIELIIGLTIPGLVWVIVGILIFGLSEAVSLFSVAIILTPIFSINIWEGMRNLDQKLVEMAKIYRSNWRLIIKKVIIPQLMPYIFAGTRFGLGVAWKVVVLAELFALSNGVGYKISDRFELVDLKGVIAWSLLFCIVMIIIEYGVVSPIERRIVAWRKKVIF